MALYKYSHYLTSSTDPLFDPTYKPAEVVPHSGIYKCQGCGREAACNTGEALPPQSHHEHDLPQGAVLWRLIVATGS
jgi:hypothetical protein